MFERDSAEQLHYVRQLVDQVPALMAYWDRNLLCRYANRAYARWFGTPPEKLVGRSIHELLGPALFELNRPHIEAVLTGEAQTFERVVPGPDGVQRHSIASYVPDVVDGVVVGFLAQVTETTLLKQTEERLRSSKSLLDRTGRLAGVGGWELDILSGALTWSEQTRRIHEVGPDYQPRLETAIGFYTAQGRPLIEAAVDAALKSGTPWDLELPLVSATGKELWVRAFGEVEYVDGVPVRLTGAIQDVTEQRRRREALGDEQRRRALLESHALELDRLLRERSDMLDVMAHEVRQPLNNASAALQGAAAALRQMGETVAATQLSRAQDVMSDVLGRIDNTLAVAALLARPDPIEQIDSEVELLLDVAIADMHRTEHARIQVENPARIRTAWMDMSLMRLALRNVLSNALKYSPAGSPIVLRVTEIDEPMAVAIDVIDTGSGIPAALVANLFQRGTHRRSSFRVEGHGMGLGLFITRRVMELHGGRAELLRNESDGVTVRLTLPVPSDG